MTREEASFILMLAKNRVCDNELNEALDMAIKALNQEPILEKIRGEIEQLPIKTRTNWDGCCPDFDYPQIEYVDVSKDKLLSIIDKYIAESEEE